MRKLLMALSMVGSLQGARHSLPRRHFLVRRAGCLLAVAGMMSGFGVLTGCGIRLPVKATPVTQGPGGKNTVADSSAIRPGTSTREEILRDWGWCDTRVQSDQLFVCRVRRSTFQWIETVVTPVPVPYSASRDWNIDYLFVEFDDKGIVSKTYFVSGYHLARGVLAWTASASQSRLDVSQPIEIKSVEDAEFYETIILHSDSIELHLKNAKNPVVLLAAGQLRSFHDCGMYIAEDGIGIEGANLFCLGLSGAQRSAKTLTFRFNVPDLITFVRYLNQVAPSALPKPTK